MQTLERRPHRQFRTLKLVYVSLAVAIALFALAVLAIDYVQLMQQHSTANEDLQILSYLSAAFVILSLPVSMILFGQLIKTAKGSDKTLNEKISKYQTALLLKAAILEFPALFACITVLLTGNLIVLLLIPIVLFLFFINKPSLFRLESDLELTRDEVEQLKD